MAAAYGNHVEVARALVAAGADVNRRDDQRNSPFLYAGAEGLLEILRLCAPTADPRVTNRFGGVALIPASERGHVEAVRFLLTETDIAVDHVNDLGWTALLEAVILGDGGAAHVEIVRLLLDHGADPRLADRAGVRPLEHARQRRQVAVARLLEAGG